MKIKDTYKPTILEFKNLLVAWEGLNEHLANKEDRIKSRGGITYGNEMVSYDNIVYVDLCRLDKNFNFGRVLGYTIKKWSKLVNNYCNFDYLDLIKNEVRERERKNSNNYNYTYRFDNLHGSGKDCLISLTFCRRKGYERPIVIYNTRASEATKRMIFDFLLIQRIGEYVYGKNVKFSLICIVPFMYINLECFLMYLADRGDKVIVKDKKKGYTPYQLRILQRYHEFQNMDISKIKYKVHLRAAKQVKRDKKGNPLSNCPDFFAKDCLLLPPVKRRAKEIDQLNASITIKKKK